MDQNKKAAEEEEETSKVQASLEVPQSHETALPTTPSKKKKKKKAKTKTSATNLDLDMDNDDAAEQTRFAGIVSTQTAAT